ncbi:MAG: nucleoside-triphosphatase [Candidatus Altiarchaeota archaeon]
MIIFITGKPKSGKTILVREIIKELKGRKISGIITPEFKNEKFVREGFFIKI